jgi:hypothetical protein
MANGRNPGKRRRDTGRDGSGFVALPNVVIDSPAFMMLSHPAKALLVEVARQYRGGDNGRLLITGKYLAPRNWKSADVIQRAKRELLDAGLIFQTVRGYRPNRASWFAVTWRALDKNTEYDAGAERSFRRGAYLDKRPEIGHQRNDPLTPSRGVGRPFIAPRGGAESRATTPPDGAMNEDIDPSSTPPDGIPLDSPSPLEVTLQPVGVSDVAGAVAFEPEVPIKDMVGKNRAAKKRRYRAHAGADNALS